MKGLSFIINMALLAVLGSWSYIISKPRLAVSPVEIDLPPSRGFVMSTVWSSERWRANMQERLAIFSLRKNLILASILRLTRLEQTRPVHLTRREFVVLSSYWIVFLRKNWLAIGLVMIYDIAPRHIVVLIYPS